jgi:hypothetical protein
MSGAATGVKKKYRYHKHHAKREESIRTSDTKTLNVMMKTANDYIRLSSR